MARPMSLIGHRGIDVQLWLKGLQRIRSSPGLHSSECRKSPLSQEPSRTGIPAPRNRHALSERVSRGRKEGQCRDGTQQPLRPIYLRHRSSPTELPLDRLIACRGGRSNDAHDGADRNAVTFLRLATRVAPVTQREAGGCQIPQRHPKLWAGSGGLLSSRLQDRALGQGLRRSR